jgi:hypothetical protein
MSGAAKPRGQEEELPGTKTSNINQSKRRKIQSHHQFSTNQSVRGSPTSNWIKFVKLKLDLILYTLDQDHQGLGNIRATLV